MPITADKYKDIIPLLRRGAVGILATDTIYGLVCLASNKEGVERIYKLKGRDERKPCIILISNKEQLGEFSIKLSKSQKESVAQYWPGPNSLIFPVKKNSLEYLHRGKNSLAFRLPDHPKLLKLIKSTGPIVAPSANPQGKVPAKNIAEAKKYFKNKVDFYLDGGNLNAKSSTLISFLSRKEKILRK